ncbi:RNA-binding domain-containing protein [Trametes versicolor FP-101664 SS1]|uniref:RNA-binding domain-containing protein n=1 Tax=Trametes versicolor (strain FP-101664) TaxID=717944 RepID=UPI00046248E1|nr:RNA-binding domain-containing protein [Trametes versicolor FP-101664 SS1]EIW55846.1 RNA-binding domain-containing protein [Trametes versicolor FP-101664 SS1]
MESPTQVSPLTPHEAEASQGIPPDALNELNEHLSYPAPSEVTVPLASSSASSAQPRTILRDRLYVGNLHPTVDEYALLQLFSKFGKVSKLDYLFHKAGPLKGKPRGYAFVEYSNRDDAEKALAHAHDKLVRGRKLVVTYANQAPLDASGAQGPASKYRRPVSDVGKPTTLSMLKSAGAGRSNATDAKIARMEAKLRQLETTSAAAEDSSGASAGAGASLSGHPSLPPKPVSGPIIPTSRRAPTNAASAPAPSRDRGRGRPLPILPIKPAIQTTSRPANTPLATSSMSTPSPPRAPPSRKPALTGVRMVKSKPNKSSG